MDIGPGGLERAMAQTWLALEREPLGDWVLRASGGFTNRANAALTSGDPGMPLRAALDATSSWYAARDLPLKLVRTGPVGFEVGEDELSTAALRRGCQAHSRAHVMVAPTTRVLASGGDTDAEVPTLLNRDDRSSSTWGTVDPSMLHTATDLPLAWITAYARSRSLVPGVTERVLTGSPGQVFAWLTDDDGAVWAVARLGIVEQWGGLAAVWVEPARRRTGAGRALTAALVREAADRGIERLHLQVEVDNAAAITLYAALGFELHHDYIYLTGPSR